MRASRECVPKVGSWVSNTRPARQNDPPLISMSMFRICNSILSLTGDNDKEQDDDLRNSENLHNLSRIFTKSDGRSNVLYPYTQSRSEAMYECCKENDYIVSSFEDLGRELKTDLPKRCPSLTTGLPLVPR